jgi:hypothetical protein
MGAESMLGRAQVAIIIRAFLLHGELVLVICHVTFTKKVELISTNALSQLIFDNIK